MASHTGQANSRGAQVRRVVVVIALAFGVVAFFRVGLMYSLRTAAAAERAGIVLNSPEAVADFRVLTGAFHLGAGLIALLGLIKRRFASSALTALLAISVAVVGTRLAGYFLGEGIATRPAVMEIAALVFFAIGLWCSRRRTVSLPSGYRW